jgi:hypothetical protein
VKKERISEAFDGNHGGTVVIADTEPQVINKACKGEMTVFLMVHVWQQSKQNISFPCESCQL